VILEKKKIIFIHIPKTGGNTISHLLKNHSDDKFIKHRPYSDLRNTFEIRSNLTKDKHQTLEEYYNILGNKFNDYKIFTVVREPLDRILSLYYKLDLNLDTNFFVRKVNHFTFKYFKSFYFGSEYYKFRKPKFKLEKFKKILETEKNQKSYISILDQIPDKIKIVKFENLKIELKNLCKEFDIQYEENHFNKSPTNKYEEISTEELKKEVENSHHSIDYEFYRN